MGKISRFFGRINEIVGNILKPILPHKWLTAKKPFRTIGNQYSIYGLKDYVFGAQEGLGIKFLFPGLKEIATRPRGLIEREFKNIPATTIDGLNLKLDGMALLKIDGKKGAVQNYTNDADLKYADELISKYTATIIGREPEIEMEGKINKIEKKVTSYFTGQGEGKKLLDNFGVTFEGVAWNPYFDENSQNGRKGYAELQKQITKIKAQAEIAQQKIQAKAPVRIYEKIYDKLSELNTAGKIKAEEVLDWARRMYQDQMTLNYTQNPGSTIVMQGNYNQQFIPIPTKNNSENLEERV